MVGNGRGSATPSEKTSRRAERDAEQTRLEAVASANRVFEQIAALERPLADLEVTLRVESNRVQEELEDNVGSEMVASANRVLEEIAALERPLGELVRKLRLESNRVQGELAHQGDDELGAAPTEAESPPEEADPEATEPREPRYHEPPASTTPVTAPETERKAPKGRRFSRLRPGTSKQPFVERPGHCGVCHRTFEAGSEHALRQSGWKVNGDVGLCPEDQAKGWQLPEGARIPFRPGARFGHAQDLPPGSGPGSSGVQPSRRIAFLSIMAQDPNRDWHLKELKPLMVAAGVIEDDAVGTNRVSAAAAGTKKCGEVAHVGPSLYRITEKGLAAVAGR